MRVAILPTGVMELLGLPAALKTLFPAHEFESIAKLPHDRVPFDSFTSSPKALVPNAPNGNVDKIVQRMAGGLVPGHGGRPPDLLLVLEDVEVPNKHQPEVVVQVFREATLRHVEERRRVNPRLADQVEEALRSKASFHLAVPMIESWVFADPNGPGNVGVDPARWPPSRVHQRDPEDFLADDPTYLADDCSGCTAWHALPPGRAKEHRPAWYRERREAHPKAFLSWLCRDPGAKKCSHYRETHEGAQALGLLDWAAALRVAGHCTFLRALVEDIAVGLGEVPAVSIEGEVATVTKRRERREPRVLRSI